MNKDSSVKHKLFSSGDYYIGKNPSVNLYKEHKELAQKEHEAKQDLDNSEGLLRKLKAKRAHKVAHLMVEQQVKQAAESSSTDYLGPIHQEALREYAVRHNYEDEIEKTLSFNDQIESLLDKDKTFDFSNYLGFIRKAKEQGTLPAYIDINDESTIVTVSGFRPLMRKPFTSTYKWDEPYAEKFKMNAELVVDKDSGAVILNTYESADTFEPNDFEDKDDLDIAKTLSIKTLYPDREEWARNMSLLATFDALNNTVFTPKHSKKVVIDTTERLSDRYDYTGANNGRVLIYLLHGII